MSYESRAYDDKYGQPVVVLVVTGTHDVSRLVSHMTGGVPTVEQLEAGRKIVRQVKRHNGGRAAVELLAAHGGPDLTKVPITFTATGIGITRTDATGHVVLNIPTPDGRVCIDLGIEYGEALAAMLLDDPQDSDQPKGGQE